MKLIQYTVTSKGYNFPMDMLRYDNSWPCASEDVETLNNINRASSYKLATIILRGLRCTPDRWKSFGWTVTEQHKV